MNLADGVILLTVAALIAGVIKIMRIQNKCLKRVEKM